MRNSKEVLVISSVAVLLQACSTPSATEDTSTSGTSQDQKSSDTSQADMDGSSDVTSSDDESTGDDASTEEMQDVCDANERDGVGPRLLRRMTVAQMEATIRDAFELGASQWNGLSLPPDPASRDGFNNNADRLRVGATFAKELSREAKEVAAVVAESSFLQSKLACASAGGIDCAREYVEKFGQRLYRRPLSDAETARYLELFATTGGEADFSSFITWSTIGLLQSPNFIFRTELGEKIGNDRYELDPFELASAISFTYTGRPPSDALLEQAKRGDLSSPEELRDAAKKLAVSAKDGASSDFRAVFEDFIDHWVYLARLRTVAKDAAIFPDFSQGVQDSMRAETMTYLDELVLRRGGSISEVLSSKTTYLDKNLAQYYGYGDASGSQFEAVTRPEKWGAGLLSHGSLLAITGTNTYTSPTKRGVLVRERILCHEVGTPPAVVPQLPDASQAKTTRERYEILHAVDKACSFCHQQFDPVGFAFEHLDTSGRYREQENGYEIDATGTLLTTAKDYTFDGPQELAQILAAQDDPSYCVASFVAGNVFGLEHSQTSCLISTIADDFTTSKGAIFDLYLDMTLTRTFRERKAK